ncbi:MAG TPA: SEC-C metal-binding domain-containing protein, partial [Acetobacteraceae bacterium]|nr:SEC-C metal-binding domain-containing protein [Acetobacteraceae bacterium]
LATITFQNYFRLFPKLAGMTGTAMTEADEFMEIYKLHSVEVPTNVPVIRDDGDDEVYRSAAEKYDAVGTLIEEARGRLQPVLVGTVSIEKSELLSEILNKRGVPHNVLNARFHEQEAHIIAEAGRPGAVTIATNMAGRGTDIKLGGNLEARLRQDTADIADPAVRSAKEAEIRAEIAEAHDRVKQAGGLFVIGTERHESRRIDNQLRGRSGRQGDPGASRFFLSLEDDLMRIFGSDRMGPMLQRLGLKDGEAIVHPWINKALEKAQKKVEARNFDTRKNLLKYDDVMNDQRREVYAQRREFMQATDLSETIRDMRAELVADMVQRRIPERAFAEQWETAELAADVKRLFNLDLPIQDWGREEGIDETAIRERLEQAVEGAAEAKATAFGPEIMRFIEKSLLLQVFDTVWKEHLLALDHLRQGIGLRAYGQRDPLNEYKSEAFALFNAMLDEMRERVCSMLSRVELSAEPPPPLAEPAFDRMLTSHPNPGGDGAALAEMEPVSIAMGAALVVNPNDPSTWSAASRNAPCPCGSGKKYKHCHGREA